MGLRDLVLYNFRWKLTALLLAMLVWSVIKFSIYKEFTGGKDQVLKEQPVMVLKAPEDTRVFRMDPGTVDVVMRAAMELDPEDVEVFVDLRTMPDVNSALKPVLVRAADSVRVVSTDPAFVMVERVPVPVFDTALTNSLPSP